MANSWHDQAVEQVAIEFKADLVHGLATGEAAERLHTHGPNALRKGKPV
ncbi:MAG: cation-transporting P-type ATPase, partial [Gammaproteobacteria bacterium]|nr:cation-transporting P-type ATPase [Gammaproteobacteria bacterium]